MEKLRIEDLTAEYLRGKRVFVRVDVDAEYTPVVPHLDEYKIRLSLPTLDFLIKAGARVLVGAHLGDPVGVDVEWLRLDGMATVLQRLMDKPVRKLHQVVGEEVLSAVSEMQDGDLVVLENLLFHPGEETNDAHFATQLAAMCDIYCNDAFSVAHRAFASTVAITRYVRPAVAGMSLSRELMMFEALLDRSAPPFLGIIAGARLREKLPILENLMPRFDVLFIGGALSFTFLKADGTEVGQGPVDDDFLPLVKDFLKKARGRTEVVLPRDFVAVRADDFRDFQSGATTTFPEARQATIGDMRPTDVAVDIGPQTLDSLRQWVASAQTVLWNGPVGVYEIEPFAEGTRQLAKALIDRGPSLKRLVTCGDDLTRAIRNSGLPFERIRHLSTGGESALQLLAGFSLPAVAALDEAAPVAPAAQSRILRLLLAVDGSDSSIEMAKRIGNLVDAERADIELVYVQQSRLWKSVWADLEAKRQFEIERRIEAEGVFRSINGALASQGLISHQQFDVEGDVATEILRCAEELDVDLIAMGSHGRVSQKVANRSTRPVLVVKAPDLATELRKVA